MGHEKSGDEDVVIVRDDDPRRTELESSGYRIVGRSWGARLHLTDEFDPQPYNELIARAEQAGYRILELDVDYATALHTLLQTTQPDFPFTPATPGRAWAQDEVGALWGQGWKVFGALVGGKLVGGKLVGATMIKADGDRAETESTSVLRAHRGKGIGAAVKAASILALALAGVRTFGTGGAQVNQASIAMNRACGYEITEQWLSYERPAVD